MKTSTPLRKRAGGFTLAEVVIAVGIIAIGFLGSFAMVLQCGKQASAAEESSLACSGLEEQMDLLRTLSWTALTDGTGVTATVWNSQPPVIAGLPVTQETITISPYNQANTQTLTATWNVPGSPSVVLAPAAGGAIQALSTATAVQVVATITWTGRRSGRQMTQSLVTVIAEGGISAGVPRNASTHQSGYTLVEVMTAACIFSLFASALLETWTVLGTSSLNTVEYCQSQNDQMRTIDYLKRDIRRATSIQIYNGGTFVIGTNNWGSTLQLTLPKYYTDSRQEDDSIGTRVVYTPTLTNGVVTYGTPLTVQYYLSNGATIHNESGTARAISDGGAIDALTFCTDPTGLIHCRISYTQIMRSGSNRTLHRQVNILCGQRSTL